MRNYLGSKILIISLEKLSDEESLRFSGDIKRMNDCLMHTRPYRIRGKVK
jgi:hypothetical protein